MAASTSSLAELDSEGPSTCRIRSSLAALVLSALLLPLAGFPPSVVLDVDGERVVARAAVTTVAQALELAGVELAEGDDVRPALHASPADVAEVRIARAIDIVVELNGTPPFVVRTSDATPSGALRAAGLGALLATGPVVTPGHHVALVDGDLVQVSARLPLTVLIPGEGVHRMVWVVGDTVGDALRELGLERGPLDRVEPASSAWLTGPTTVRITRVVVEEDRREIVISREVRRVEDARLLRGVVRVDQSGRDGLLVEIDRVTLIDGVETSRVAHSSEVVTEPRERIERHGTMVAPPPTVWDDLARCESGQRWDIVRHVNASTSYHGGLQFLPSTWNAFRPVDFPEQAHEASRAQQIQVAERVRAGQGWGAWPACSRRLGLR